MAESFIQVAADGAGKQIDTFTSGAGSTHRQAVVLSDPADPAGVLSVLPSTPDSQEHGAPVRVIGEEVWTWGATSVLASTVDPAFFTEIVRGTGVGASQAGGNFLITTGTSTNAEYLAQSVPKWRSSMLLRYQFTASQRIANQNLWILLADLIGNGLSCTVNGTTSISVTKAAHGFTSVNIGQSMMVGAIAGVAGVPGQYAIASIPDANTINFTVAGWPASGSCTVSLFGWNYIHHLYNGVTATNLAFDTQRKGWSSGDTTATINTTAAPGHMVQTMLDGRDVYMADALVASTTTPTVTTRASRMANIPDDSQDLYVFIWSFNGTSSPATTTTWTVGFISVERFANLPVFVAGNRQIGQAAPTPITGTMWQATQPVSGTVTANGGTIATPTVISLSSAATTNATSSKNAAGTLYSINASNTGAAAAFLKLYNKASAPTVGTDVPVLTITVPPGDCRMLEFGPLGFRFALGIAFAITNLAADSDTTAVALAQVKVIGSYV